MTFLFPFGMFHFSFKGVCAPASCSDQIVKRNERLQRLGIGKTSLYLQGILETWVRKTINVQLNGRVAEVYREKESNRYQNFTLRY